MALGTTPQPPYDRPSWGKKLTPTAIVALMALVALALVLAKFVPPISGY